jgi:hypothetical protein
MRIPMSAAALLAVVALAHPAFAAPAKAKPMKLCVASDGSINIRQRCLKTETTATMTELQSASANVEDGAQGIQGPQGPIGPQGLTGPKGDKGDQGFQGVQGPQGVQGAQGMMGPQGLAGARGEQGDRGLRGARGATGPQGATGQAGPQGAEGPVGPQGPEGPFGPQGLTGPKGDKGEPGADGIVDTARCTRKAIGGYGTVTANCTNPTSEFVLNWGVAPYWPENSKLTLNYAEPQLTAGIPTGMKVRMLHPDGPAGEGFTVTILCCPG